MQKTNKHYGFIMEVEKADIDQIFHEIEAAREVIYNAYNKLNALGVLKLKGTIAQDSPNQ